MSKSSVVEIAPGEFNTDRPKCRYFVLTAELGARPIAGDGLSARGLVARDPHT